MSEARTERIDFSKIYSAAEGQTFCIRTGQVTDVRGQIVIGHLPGAQIGSVCEIINRFGGGFGGEVIGIENNKVLILPYEDVSGVGLSSELKLLQRQVRVRVSSSLLGRVVNGFGEPLDNLGPIENKTSVPLYVKHTNPLSRKPIEQPLDLGVKAINSFMTVGKGQRISIMAGSGVGKSTLMGMIAKNTSADVNVIALIGERGREVRDFVEDTLGPEGLKKSIVVAVTSDENPILRVRGAHLATSIAEYFSSQNQDVLLIMDSVTRFAMAQREIGLNRGEAPTTRGYTSSLYPSLSNLLERAGNFESGGSVTGIYTVLVEGDDINDPVSDTVRSIVDGHIVLSRELAEKYHYPAIDVQQSLSRLMTRITDKDHQVAAGYLRRLMATYKKSEDLINIGVYKKGSDAEIDLAIEAQKEISRFLQQGDNESSTIDQVVSELQSIFYRYGSSS